MMLNQKLNQQILVTAFAATISSSLIAPATFAQVAPVFQPYLAEIVQSIPVGVTMRLPSRLLLSSPFEELASERLIIRTFPSSSPLRYTVGLYACDSPSQPCLIGTFSAESRTGASAVRELGRHIRLGDPITLAPGLQGYLLEGKQQKPAVSFSSVMWRQNDMVYTIVLPEGERQNLLLMAYSMANNVPLYRR